MAKNEKRQRKKDQRRQRIEAEIRAYKTRRRNRMLVQLGIVAVLAGATALFISQAREPEPESTPASDVACGGETPKRQSVTPLASEPPLVIDQSKTYRAEVKTSCGTVNIELADDTQPRTVNSFVILAQRGFYNGLTFHRLVKDFAIQGGDPDGDGTGGPGYKVTEELPPGVGYTRGVVAMAKGPDEVDPPGTSGSQFFIVPGDRAVSLEPKYAILGKVVGGMDVVERINELPTESPESEKPEKKIYIESITVTDS